MKPELDDDKGMTALLVNSNSGKVWLDKSEVVLWPTEYENILRSNPALERSAVLPKNRKYFYEHVELPFKDRICKYARPALKQQVKNWLMRVAYRILTMQQKKMLKRFLRKE